MKKTWMAILLSLMLTAGAAAADTISFDGTVEAASSVLVTAPVGGTVAETPVSVGDTVAADTVIARIRTNKVYAAQDGTVTAIYGQPGDDAETVAATWGAVMYLEGETLFTVSANTSRAYDDKANYIVHSGEKVYLVSRNHTLDKGEGIISEVTESAYTVRVIAGNFYVGDSVDVFREENASAASRIGRGTVARVAPDAVTGSGSIVSYAVQAGESVKRGQLLFETVDGSYDGLAVTGTDILAGTEGTIASLSAEVGGSLSADSTVAVIYPKGAVRVAVEVPEADLKELHVGQMVKVELDWNQDEGVQYEGTVERISSLGSAGDESTFYTMYVSFTPDEDTRYGMTAIVTTIDENAEAAEGEKADTAEAETAADASEETEGAADSGAPEAEGETAGDESRQPDGFPNMGEMPSDGERPAGGERPSGGGRPGRDGRSGGSSEENSAGEDGASDTDGAAE